jgi:uncharacterized protein (DUF1501 family)
MPFFFWSTSMLSRRDFLRASLQTSTLVALAPSVPAFLERTARAAQPQRDGRVLVVIELRGGNDGINTVVPFKDEGYAKNRTFLRLPDALRGTVFYKDQLLKLNDELGLNPTLVDAAKLLEAGHLAIVQGVGYPNPSRSHFKSRAIWYTANVNLPRSGEGEERPDPESAAAFGWIGRVLDGLPKATGASASGVFIGTGALPRALSSRRSVVAALTRPEDALLNLKGDAKASAKSPEGESGLDAFVRRQVLDAYATSERMAEVVRAKDGGATYPATALGGRLRVIARLLKAGLGTRVFYTGQEDYDTHYGQVATHPLLLNELGGALKAFLDDLAAAKLAERVAVLCFSEFGRTVKENREGGTDHGTAGPVFLAGPKVQAGVVGKTPSLLDLEEGELKMSVDFRRVYATVLDKWLGLPSKPALGADFEPLPLFRS